MLGGRAVEQIDPSAHLGHVLECIIEHHGKLVGEHAVGPADHAIAAIARERKRHVTLKTIMEADHPIADSESPRWGLAGCQLTSCLRIKMAARPWIDDMVARMGCGGSMPIRTRAETRVDPAKPLKALESFKIGIGARTLIHRAAIPLESEPFEVIHAQIGKAL